MAEIFKAKIVVNRCFGGFELSNLAYEELIKMGVPFHDRAVNYAAGEKASDAIFRLNKEGEYQFHTRMFDYNRHHPLLVAVVEKLGDKASGPCSKLQVVELGVSYWISDTDGLESVGIIDSSDL